MTHICSNCGTECAPPGVDFGEPIRANDGEPMCSPGCKQEYEAERDSERGDEPVTNITVEVGGEEQLSWHFNEQTAEAVMNAIELIVALADDNTPPNDEPNGFLRNLLDERDSNDSNDQADK